MDIAVYILFITAVSAEVIDLCGIYQSVSYKTSRFLRSLKNPRIYQILVTISAFLIVLSSIIDLQYAKALYISGYFIIICLLIYNNLTKRIKIKWTKRFIRDLVFSIVCILSFAVFTFIFSYLIGNISLLLLNVLIIAPMSICEYAERINNQKYIRSSKLKMINRDIRVIGITGSYGKTSVKNYLYQILSVRNFVLKTPGNVNTDIGVAAYINKNDMNADYFICEMGARKSGDISNICDIVEPTYGIITGINEQHIEYFKKIENTVKEKCALSKCVLNNGGKVCASLCCSSYKMLLENCAEGSFLIRNSDYLLLNDSVKNDPNKRFYSCFTKQLSKNGSIFMLKNHQTDKKYEFDTKLIGSVVCENLSLSIIAAFDLGMRYEEIKKAVMSIEPVEHRFYVTESNDITIIDDGYNSNVDGFRSAVMNLSLFEGRKILVSGGVIELGRKQYGNNFDLGRYAAHGVDVFIIVKRTNKKALKKGFLSQGVDPSRVYYAPSLKKAMRKYKRIKMPGDVILFENDIP